MHRHCSGEPPKPPGPPSPPGPAPPAPPGSGSPLVLLNGSRCLDGSPAGYYFQPAAPTGRPGSSSSWAFYLHGGGACADEPSCTQRANSQLGSSTDWPRAVVLGAGKGAGDVMISNSSAANPDFWDWNHVYIPYCSGDTHAGQRTAATADTYGLYFR